MAHFAELDVTNRVLRVLVVDADDGADGTLRPPRFCTEVLGGRWVRTFYATPGKRYAGVGDTYDAAAADFTPPPAPPTPEQQLSLDAEFQKLNQAQRDLVLKFLGRVT